MAAGEAGGKRERAVAEGHRGRSSGKNWKVLLELEGVSSVIVLCSVPDPAPGAGLGVCVEPTGEKVLSASLWGAGWSGAGLSCPAASVAPPLAPAARGPWSLLSRARSAGEGCVLSA